MASPTHYANLMIRYMVATKLATLCPGLVISGVHMPYWGIALPAVDLRDGERCFSLVAEQHVPFERMAYLWRSGIFSRFEWHGYGQRMENFPDKPTCRNLFSTEVRGRRLSEDCVACPVRGAEILHAIHPGYTTVPVDFYSEIVEASGLTPVFFGQTEDNLYTRALRDRFPRSEFLPHEGVLQDFQTIRNAANIILPVSTFAWLAAWLSDAKRIVLPVFGIFDPKVFGLHDLLPLGESAYEYHQFPPEPAVPLAELEDAHRRLKGRWIKVDPLSLAVGRA